MPSPSRPALPLKRGELPPKKVAWFDPLELLRTAYHVWLATVATEYLDRRDTMAALDWSGGAQTVRGPFAPGANVPDGWRRGHVVDAVFSPNKADVDRRDGVWIDYVADIGDSWQATYAVATLLATPELVVPALDRPLPAADILALGGDLVYPTPTRDRYRRRTGSALSAALPSRKAADRTLVAIPGNHDWYDGLTNFLRMFCQGGRLGGWQLVQRRSYFAIRIEPKWWLWGIDIALDTRIDPPQQAFFLDILNGAARVPHDECVQRGDTIILCTAKPAWIETSRYSDDSYRNLAFFLHEILQKDRHDVPIVLTGDLHHYMRYENRRGTQLVISGGGGGYLMGTHNMPPRVPEPNADPDFTTAPDPATSYSATRFPYPSAADSRRLARHALFLAFRPANWRFALLVGALYYAMVRAIVHLVTAQELASRTLRQLVNPPYRFEPHPGDLALLAVIAAMCVLFAIFANHRSRRIATAPWGLAHAVGHAALGLVLAWAATHYLMHHPPGSNWMWAAQRAVGVVGGGLAGTTAFGLYLVLSDRWFAWHTNETFAGQSIVDYRNFVRLRIAPNGELSLYVIGLERVPRKWRIRTERKDDESPFYEPVDEVLKPHLIEGPIRIGRRPQI